jgi:hypothetical protein
LEGGPPRFGPRFTGAVLLRNVIRRPLAFAYGTIAHCGVRFHAASANERFCNSCQAGHDLDTRPTTPDMQRVAPCTCPVWADPFSLATTQGVSVDFLSSGYLDVSVPPLTRAWLCVHHALTRHYPCRVYPFGNPRIKGCSTPPRGLSQSSTSFVGSWCQGIHHVPLTS